MTADNGHALRRFGMKAAILALIAAAERRYGFAATLGVLCGIAALIDVGLALYRRSPSGSAGFTYWDEAAAFTVLGAIAAFLARS